MLKLNDIKISKDFRLYEFQSPDTNQVLLDPELIIRLQGLRDLLEKPIIIDSGYRTPDHNKAVDGKQYSYHLLGKAADIRVENIKLDDLFQGCVYIGFRGIIVYQEKKFIHVDVRSGSFITAPPFWKTTAIGKNMFKRLEGKSRNIKILTEKSLLV